MNRLYKWYVRMHNSNSSFCRKLIERYLRVVYCCELPASVVIGDNCVFAHNGLGCTFHPEVVIGNNCHINQNVTIGGRAGLRGVPIIGDNVLIGAHSILLGPIVVGDNALIGAGAIVVKDVPANAVVVNEPAKVIKIRETNH